MHTRAFIALLLKAVRDLPLKLAAATSSKVYDCVTHFPLLFMFLSDLVLCVL